MSAPSLSEAATTVSLLRKARRAQKKRPTEPTLDTSLIKCLRKSNYHDPEQEFYPASGVRDLITVRSIEKEFSRFIESTQILNELEDREGFLRGVSEQCHKTFATAVVTGLQSEDLLYFMQDFLYESHTDADLSTISEKRICEYMDGNSGKAHIFCIQRWKFLAPIFSPAQYDYNLENDCIFPFTKDATMSRSGAFGTVSRVEIHADHLKHSDMQYVAVKEIQIPRDGEQDATDKAWDDEAKALRGINELNHSNITQCIAAIRRGERRYFMFKWAEGGNLQEFWKKAPKHNPDGRSIRDMIEQLRGLVDALDALHNCRSGKQRLLMVPDSHSKGSTRTKDNDKSIRHGDLKPENILRFISRQETESLSGEFRLGTLKIADMGLAKQHIVATHLRTNTSQRYGTIRYEAPEAIIETRGRSRLYDIWSFGCITLEFIIWVLYGNNDLEEFYNQVEAGRQQTCQYFELHADRKGAVVHHTVNAWIRRMQSSDPECSQDTAIRDLLDLVLNRLLVINLEPKTSSSVDSTKASPIYRASAAEIRMALDVILEKAKQDRTYLFTGKSRDKIQLPRKTDFLTPNAPSPRHQLNMSPRSNDPSTRVSSVLSGRLSHLEYSLPPLKDWEFPIDNAFANRLHTDVGAAAFPQPPDTTPSFCARCRNLDFFKGGFTLVESLTSLKESASACDLCSMLNAACRQRGGAKGDNILIERIQSNLKLSGGDLPILSILRSSELQTPTPIQMGLPMLPNPGSAVFYTLIRLWLQDCDAKHAGCRPVPQHKTPQDDLLGLPTRLIDVGTKNEPRLRLLETKDKLPTSRDYIALSHPWGDVKVYPPFSTSRKDSSGLDHDVETFKNAIPYGKLPATFKDAVDCTRALGIQYLWIDSICIIQGRDGDFNEESQNMEEVFSGAYCVLAASRASHQHSGFLGPRAQRKYIPFHRSKGKPFYICDPIDDFGKDVIEGSLNQRGWVLQERALARRTIYFTESQTYFECGNGIRCETLANMHNNMADFIGDPRFPEKAMSANHASRALQIAYYQDLYKLYSRLEFSHDEDRPFAIAGLERRLRQAFGTQGGFGIFDDGDKSERGLFHRSILWRRGDEKELENGLEPINFSKRGFHVPSWSWMAYKGGIDYTTPEGGTADWETNEISEPWTRGGVSNTRSAPQEGVVAIQATVRDFQVANRLADEVKLYYDTGRTKGSDGQRAQCVVVAKHKQPRFEGLKRHYVLLVAPRKGESGRGRKVYERIGAGYMLGKHIIFSGPGIEAEIW